MEFKNTIITPKTDFPMKAGLPAREPAMLQRWEEQDLYNLMLEKEFPDSADNLVAGQTYYCTLKIEASNGVVTTRLDKKAFTFQPPTAE